jgi:DNA polymerase kappa
MDMFFAAVETRDNPELAEVPMGVGSKGMISTSNYIARKFGISSGMPLFIAQRLCPDIVYRPEDKPKYRSIGR